MDYKTYTTDRLELRPTLLEDAAFIMELVNSPKWIQNIGDRNVKSIEEAENYIRTKMHPQLERLGFGNFTIIRKIDGSKIGTCGLYDRDGLEGLDIGFAMLPDYEGKGYGYEAARKVFNLAFNEFKLPSLSGITTRENIASQRLLEKLGLTYSCNITIPNDDEELMLYETEEEID